MQAIATPLAVDRYAKCVDVSKRIRWDIDRDVIRGRRFDLAQKFLPDDLTLVTELPFLSIAQQRLLGQVQGRTYAGFLGVFERFVGVKMLELGGNHALGNQSAVEALVRFTDEELKHQELFRRVDALIAREMPNGYRFIPEPNDVALFVLARSTWAVLALTCHLELLTQQHYRDSIDGDPGLSPLFKDVFFFHWKEETQHVLLDELEWRLADGSVSDGARDRGVDELVAMIAGLDELVQAQAAADARYFIDIAGSVFTAHERSAIEATLLRAYRRQTLGAGLAKTRFRTLFEELAGAARVARVEKVFASRGPR